MPNMRLEYFVRGVLLALASLQWHARRRQCTVAGRLGPLAILLLSCLLCLVPQKGAATDRPAVGPYVDAGVVLHVASDPSVDTWTLGGDGRCLFYAITQREEYAAQLRQAAGEDGRLGLLTVEHRNDISTLPLATHLANLVVIDDWSSAKQRGLRLDEVLRVTSPFGSVFIAWAEEAQIRREIEACEPRSRVASVSRQGLWLCLSPALPEGMGEWSHPAGGPGNRRVADDRLNCKVFNPLLAGMLGNLYQPGIEQSDRSRSSLWPRWIAGEHRSGPGNRYDSLLVAGGHVFGVSNIEALAWHPDREATEFSRGQKVLVVRDAFNGLVHWYDRSPRRVFAANRHVVVCSAPLGFAALDAATGEDLWFQKVYGVDLKLLLLGDVVVWSTRAQVQANATDSGAQRWTLDVGAPVQALMADGDLVLAEVGEATNPRRRDSAGGATSQRSLLALKPADGTEIWKLHGEAFRADGQELHLVCTALGRGLLASNDRLRVIELSTGKTVLDHERIPVKRAKSAGGANRRTIHLAGDYLMMDVPGGFRFVNLMTRREHTVPETTLGGMGAWPCNGGGTFTMGTILSSLSQEDPAEASEHELIGHVPVKNTCGEVPPVAYHTAYQAPHKCCCEALFGRLRGFVAASPVDPVPPRSAFEKPGPLVKGPRFGVDVDTGDRPEWPCFRADNARSCAVAGAISSSPAVQWRQRLTTDWPETRIARAEWRARHLYSGRISAPVADGSTVFVALPDDHQLVALDASTGKERWRLTAGGAIDSPPTLYKGRCLFGCRDGRFYCVDAHAGELIWQRRISPVDERVQVYGQLENRFPVRGSVTVRDGRVYATSGLHGFMGVMLCVADPLSGDVFEYRQLPRGAYHNDVLVEDPEEDLFLGPLPLDPKAAAAALTPSPRDKFPRFHRVDSRTLGTRDTVEHLLSLDSEILNVAKTVSPIAEPQVAHIPQRRVTFLWYLHGQRALSWTWNDRLQIGVRSRTLLGWKRVEEAREQGQTLVDDLTGPVVALSRQGVTAHLTKVLGMKHSNSTPLPKIDPLWQRQLGTVWVVAMADDQLIAGGPVLKTANEDPLAAEGRVRVLDAATGNPLMEIDLPRAPIQDGVAVAGGRVFLSLCDGSLVCLN